MLIVSQHLIQTHTHDSAFVGTILTNMLIVSQHLIQTHTHDSTFVGTILANMLPPNVNPCVMALKEH